MAWEISKKACQSGCQSYNLNKVHCVNSGSLKLQKRNRVPKLEGHKRHLVQRHIPSTPKYGSTPSGLCPPHWWGGRLKSGSLLNFVMTYCKMTCFTCCDIAFNSNETLFTFSMLLNWLKTVVIWAIMPHVYHIWKKLESISPPPPISECEKRSISVRSEPSFSEILCSGNNM